VLVLVLVLVLILMLMLLLLLLLLLLLQSLPHQLGEVGRGDAGVEVGRLAPEPLQHLPRSVRGGWGGDS
jgi:hypothetical protein